MKYLIKGILTSIVGITPLLSISYAMPHTGEVFYTELGCVECHGKNGGGVHDTNSLIGKDYTKITQHMIDARQGLIKGSAMNDMDRLEGKEETIAMWLSLIVNQDIE